MIDVWPFTVEEGNQPRYMFSDAGRVVAHIRLEPEAFSNT